MAITTEKIITAIEQSALAPPNVLAEMKRRVANAPGKVDPRSITKWLVQKKHITVEEALELLAGRTVDRSAAASVEDELEVLQDDDLVLADDLEEVSDDDLVTIDDEPPPKPAPKKSQPARPAPSPAAKAASSQPARSAAAAPAKRSTQKPAARSTETPLDDLLDDSALDSADLGGAGAAKGSLLAARATLPGAHRTPKRKEVKNVWDSPFLLIGGGLLLLLLFAGGFLVWRISTGSGDKALELADEAYKAGSYTQAVAAYDEFLKSYPKHKGADVARVHRGLARMRQSVDGTSDWSKTLVTTKGILREIAPEKEFAEARAELAVMLPNIAEGLAQSAKKSLDHVHVGQAEEALALVEKYVLKSLLPGTQIEQIKQSLELTKRQMARGDALNTALAGIKAATAAGKNAEAYAIRKDLLKKYQDLISNTALREAIEAVSQNEKQAVKSLAQPVAAETAELPTSLRSSLALVTRTPGNVSSVEGRLVFAVAEGSAYALNAATGKVLWHRPVGFDTQFVPRPITRAGNVDALLVDSRTHELVCVEGATGKLRWRHPLEEPLDANPLILRNRIAVPCRSGRMVLVDAETGGASGSVRLPQKLAVSPAVDQGERRLYQLAEHSNLFILAAQTGQCDEVVYLAHEPSSVAVPPLVAVRFLMIAENTGHRDATLRVFLTNEQGLAPKPVQTIPLEGQVHAPLQLFGRQLMVATDRGALYIFEVGGAEKKEPLTRVATKGSTDTKSLVRYCFARGAELWSADQSLTKFEVQSTQGKLAAKWVKHAGDVFLQSIEVGGEALFLARRRSGVPGVAVSAVSMSDGVPLWESHVAAALAPAVVDEKTQQITLLNRAGGVFRPTAAELSGSVLDNKPEMKVDLSDPSIEYVAVSLEKGIVAFSPSNNAEQLVIVDPAVTPLRPRAISLPGTVKVAPQTFQGRLAATSSAGTIMLLDALGKPAADPFQPRLVPGAAFAWQGPEPIGGNECVVSDGLGKLYRLGLQDKPRPHLASLGEVELPQPIVSPLAAIDSLVYGVDANRRVWCFQLPSLMPGKDWDAQGEAVWGPIRLGNQVLLANSKHQLFCFNGAQELVWTVQLAHGPLAGATLLADGKLLMASKKGVVCTVNPADGQQIAQVDVGQPLAAAPIPQGERWLLLALDGSVLTVDRL